MENDATPICEDCWVRNGAEASHIDASVWDAGNWLQPSYNSPSINEGEQND